MAHAVCLSRDSCHVFSSPSLVTGMQKRRSPHRDRLLKTSLYTNNYSISVSCCQAFNMACHIDDGKARPNRQGGEARAFAAGGRGGATTKERRRIAHGQTIDDCLRNRSMLSVRYGSNDSRTPIYALFTLAARSYTRNGFYITGVIWDLRHPYQHLGSGMRWPCYLAPWKAITLYVTLAAYLSRSWGATLHPCSPLP